MTDNGRSRAWLRVAVIYFCISVALGVAMGASGDHSLFSLHSHIGLLGWASMSLFGLIGAVHPATTRGALATLQFWTYNLSLPLFLVSLGARLKGHAGVEPVLGFASAFVGLAVLMFAFQVISALRR